MAAEDLVQPELDEVLDRRKVRTIVVIRRGVVGAVIMRLRPVIAIRLGPVIVDGWGRDFAEPRPDQVIEVIVDRRFAEKSSHDVPPGSLRRSGTGVVRALTRRRFSLLRASRSSPPKSTLRSPSGERGLKQLASIIDKIIGKFD
jgi:hypothetical protein